jgi:membrane associated rhomboid family serine protease
MSDPAPTGPSGTVPTCYRHPGREAYIRCQRCEKIICPDCMRDSAVGFQCPDCVKQGARTTRSGRTAYGGLRPSNAGITSMVIIGVNVLVWLSILVSQVAGRLYGWLALLPTSQCLSESHTAAYYPVGSEGLCLTATRPPGDAFWALGVSDGAYWQLMSSAFTHVEVWHIGFNMLALWVLGPQLELALGRVRFLALYLLSALTASVAVYWFSATNGSTVGASGAIFGLMGALLVIAYKVRGDVQQVMIWLGINAVLTFTIPHISWQGHLGGFLGGVAIAGMLAYAPRERRTVVQVAGLVGLTLLLAAAVAVRTAALV